MDFQRNNVYVISLLKKNPKTIFDNIGKLIIKFTPKTIPA